jgi:hypothetical protein
MLASDTRAPEGLEDHVTGLVCGRLVSTRCLPDEDRPDL